jgi:SAM-dependent methyltransferase
MADAAAEPLRRAADPLRRWRDDLNAWAIPDEILRAAASSPWTLPKSVFAGRTRRGFEDPSGLSHQRAAEALPASGVVLDVGCGTGAASLPLRPGGGVIGVDENPGMLAGFESFAVAEGIPFHAAPGRWPDVAARVPVADVVVCHHVLYNVPDLEPFVREMARHARRRVVIEMTARHPMSNLNPLWKRLHGLRRPDRPAATDALAAIRALGFDAAYETWSRPASADFASYDEMLEVTARRLCLSPARHGELDAALRDLGVDRDEPRLGPDRRELSTIWWNTGLSGESGRDDRHGGSSGPGGA